MTNDEMKDGIPPKFVMSNNIADTFSGPCFLTKESRRSLLRPIAITWEPLAIIFAASARPMPQVAPITRTFLYGNAIEFSSRVYTSLFIYYFLFLVPWKCARVKYSFYERR
jgi:hypothetical protein